MARSIHKIRASCLCFAFYITAYAAPSQKKPGPIKKAEKQVAETAKPSPEENPSPSTTFIVKVNIKALHVYLNHGTNHGFLKGKKVCFFDKNQRKVACGRVKSSTADKAIVKVARRIRDVKPKFEAKIETGIIQLSPYDFGVKLLWLPTILGLSRYNLLRYYAPDDPQQSASTLWESAATFSSNMGMRIGAEIDLPNSGISFGARYESRSSPPLESSYDLTNKDLYASTLTTFSSFGLFADYSLIEIASIKGGIGVDLDMNQLNLISIRGDDSGTEEEITIYSVSSTASILSIRAPLRWELFWGRFGLGIGATFFLPLLTLSGGFSATIDDELNGGTLNDGESDLRNQLGHAKNSFGMELLFSGFIGF